MAGGQSGISRSAVHVRRWLSAAASLAVGAAFFALWFWLLLACPPFWPEEVEGGCQGRVHRWPFHFLIFAHAGGESLFCPLSNLHNQTSGISAKCDSPFFSPRSNRAARVPV